MQRAAEFAHDDLFCHALVMIEDMHLEPALRTDHRGQKPDRPGAGNQKRFRLPGGGPPADALDMTPRLGDYSRRLYQDAVHAERRIELDQKFRPYAEDI